MCYLNTASVLDWNGRPKRQVKQPLRYWTEYVETDTWYVNELLSDVPESERKAALEDEDFSADVGEEGEEESDVSAASEDAEYVDAEESSEEEVDDSTESGSTSSDVL